jgi:protein disulfide-isomerase
MLSTLRAAALGMLGTLATVSIARAGEGWIADYDEAVKVALAEKKDLFVDFTGSDWCGWCKKLDAEVFAHEEFLTAVKKDFVLVALDFPHKEEIIAKVPNPKRNKELSEKYAVEGFPTILLMTPEGDVFGQTGYQAGGPAKYVEHVAELRTKGKKDVTEGKRLIEAWKSATAAAKDAAWDSLATAFEAMGKDSFAAKSLIEPLKAALDFDKDNAQGRKKRAVVALLKFGVADEVLNTAARELDPKNAEGLLEIVLESQYQTVQSDDDAKAALTALDALDALGPWKDKERNFRLHAISAFWCSKHLNDEARAKQYATKAREIGSDDADMNGMIDEILGTK